ncbi:MAG: aspartate kinase [SAR202 cluster bacterium]|nr:aspartate kinase [SAR202 cluster bacterium]
MALIVQKYGGSSVADAGAIRNVARRIADSRAAGNRTVAVVSAMGDTTDELIALAGQISDSPDPREMDVLLSTGELVSCTLLAMAIRSMGTDAISLSGAQAGIKTDTGHGKARIAMVDTSRIIEELDRGKVVIVAGFQGVSDNMNVTTLGRGASDLSAVAIAAALGADRCEVYSDVEGIFTADPRLAPDARRLDEVGFEEMLEMASYGAKMAPRSIEMAMVYGVPILVGSSFKESPGTLIHKGDGMKFPVGEIRNHVRSVAADSNVAKITIPGVPERTGSQASVFEPLTEAGISVDVIVQNVAVDGSADISFTVEHTDFSRAIQVAEQIARDLGAGVPIGADGLAKVSIVGTGMQNAPGYASRMFRALADAEIAIEMISTSEIRITCLVSDTKIGDAVRALHSAFQLDRPN